MADLQVEIQPSPEECRALAGRIAVSKEFCRASRLRDFLLYVVERRLEGATHDVTEVIIAKRVFHRPDNYNPGDDSIVRTEARILRQRLERFFAEDGCDEQLILEIPKGSYVPVFRRREPQIPETVIPPVKTKRPLRLAAALLLIAGIMLAGIVTWRIAIRDPGGATYASGSYSYRIGRVELESSDAALEQSFQWAKRRALEYVYTGDAVGDWYDSTAEDRHAFCMRDLSHQSVGAAVLGLARHTHNMMRRFAASISESRSWCGFWEINKDGYPAPVDYENDSHFWYCLPANFDMMQACYRQFLWTGDRSYFDSVFSNFYDRTVTSYVAAWDPNRDGIMESPPEAHRRGIPSYYQDAPRPLIGADLIAAQYKGYLIYAAIQAEKGSRGSLSWKLAEEFRAKAQALRVQYNTAWWNPVGNRHYSLMLPDHSFYKHYVADANVFALLFGLTEEGMKTEAALDSLQKNRPEFDQTLSYFPEVLFQYGRNEAAYQYLLELADPNFRSRGMPEVVFAVVGAVATGLMGISPDAQHDTVETLPRVPKRTAWVKLTQLPVLRNEVEVRHDGTAETSITNQSGPRFYWKASFPGNPSERNPSIVVDGTVMHATVEQGVNHTIVVSALVPVDPGQTRTARYQPRAALGKR